VSGNAENQQQMQKKV